MSKRRYQQELKRPREKHPIDLPERMLDDLSRLFLRESAAAEKEAEAAYTKGKWSEGAKHDLRSEHLRFDAQEIAYFAYVKWNDRRAHEERNLMPWERVARHRKPIKPYGER